MVNPAIPVLSCSHFHEHFPAVFLQQFYPFHTGLQDQSLEIIPEQDVAASSQDQEGHLLQAAVFQQTAPVQCAVEDR